MRKALGIFFLFLWSLVGFAQEMSVTGKVTDSQDGSLMPGVTVSIKGTTTGNITNIDGAYQISAKQGDILVFSFVGMKTQELAVTGSVLDVTLATSLTDLDDVVVIGYGVKKKSLLTGATSTVSAADMSSSVLNAEQALQGKSTGVTVTPTSGAPGTMNKVRIRGAGSNGKSEPLYIVDGMKTGDINFLNPSDIESMEVLKDAASAAIYGTEGANGVVIIKTKTGRKGEARIIYDGQYGIQSMPTMPTMMDATQYKQYMSEVRNLDKNNVPQPLSKLPSGTGNTNFMNEISANAPMQSHNLSISGASDKGSYLVSGSYTNQDGVIGGSAANFERITSRINLVQEVKPWLEVGANFSYANTKRSKLQEDDGFHGVVNSALMMDPTTPATEAVPTNYMNGLIKDGQPLLRDENGNYYGLSDNAFLEGEIYNPLIRIATTKGLATNNKIVSSQYLKLMPFKGFSFTSRLGLDMAIQEDHSWTPTFYGTAQALTNAPTVTLNDQKWSNWLWENFAAYNKVIGEHNFTILGGVSAQENIYSNINTQSGQMLVQSWQYAYPDFVSTRKNDKIGGGKSQSTMSSYFGRLSYDFSNKYLFEATVRQDGSSLFGSDNRYGIFPSVSGGWVLSEEEFWKVEAINFAKLRLSWGQNGSTSNLTPDQYASLTTTVGVKYPDATGALQTGVEPAVLANPALKWETSQQTDLGIDLRALNGKIYFTFDAYKKVTKDLLTTSTPSLSSGNTAPYWNAGEVTNSGLEFLIGVQNKTKDFSYDVSYNCSFMKNEVTKMNSLVTRIDGANAPTLNTLTYMELNQPIYYFRGYKTAGINPKDGSVNVVDVNGDGKISSDDMTNIGSPQPDFVCGLNINLAYKSFDLNVFAQGVFGQEVFKAFMRADRQQANKQISLYDDRWTPSNTTASMPVAGFSNETFYKSDLMIESGSYVKIRQIQLGYTIPTNISTKAKISSARVYVSLNDFFTFTNYTGVNPEVGSGNNNAQGVDFGTYPVSKKLLFGCSLTF